MQRHAETGTYIVDSRNIDINAFLVAIVKKSTAGTLNTSDPPLPKLPLSRRGRQLLHVHNVILPIRYSGPIYHRPAQPQTARPSCLVIPVSPFMLSQGFVSLEIHAVHTVRSQASPLGVRKHAGKLTWDSLPFGPRGVGLVDGARASLVIEGCWNTCGAAEGIEDALLADGLKQ